VTDTDETSRPEPTLPWPRECFLCFTDRMLTASGCDSTLRWVRRWRDQRAPHARALEGRLSRQGGFCDCEVFLNGFTVRDDLLVPDGNGDWDWPRERPPCAGVRAGSVQPCGTWAPRRRRW
jgi:hypothetical protein